MLWPVGASLFIVPRTSVFRRSYFFTECCISVFPRPKPSVTCTRFGSPTKCGVVLSEASWRVEIANKLILRPEPVEHPTLNVQSWTLDVERLAHPEPREASWSAC